MSIIIILLRNRSQWQVWTFHAPRVSHDDDDKINDFYRTRVPTDSTKACRRVEKKLRRCFELSTRLSQLTSEEIRVRLIIVIAVNFKTVTKHSSRYIVRSNSLNLFTDYATWFIPFARIFHVRRIYLCVYSAAVKI